MVDTHLNCTHEKDWALCICLMVGPDDLRNLFQPKQFYDAVLVF